MINFLKIVGWYLFIICKVNKTNVLRVLIKNNIINKLKSFFDTLEEYGLYDKQTLTDTQSKVYISNAFEIKMGLDKELDSHHYCLTYRWKR